MYDLRPNWNLIIYPTGHYTISFLGGSIYSPGTPANGCCSRSNVGQYKIYADVASGATSSRPQLDTMLTDLRAGQIKTIIVYKLDRLGRSLTNLLDLLAEFRNRKIRLISVSDGLDTQTDNPMVRAFWRLLGVFAELEREIIWERVMSGLERAKAAGKKLGRPAGSKDKGNR